MIIYLPIIIKLGLGILCLIVQINLMGKGNLAPSSAMDQVQNYVLGGDYRRRNLQRIYNSTPVCPGPNHMDFFGLFS